MTDGTPWNNWTAEGTPVDTEAVLFNGTTTSVNCGSDAGLDDLSDNAFTAEAWVRADSSGEGNTGRIMDKGSSTVGWGFGFTTTNLVGRVFCATTNAQSITSGINIVDGRWHHVAMFFDDAGDRKVYLAVDGVWVASYSSQDAGVGAIVSDAAEDLHIGNRKGEDLTWDGAMSWCRISDNDRYAHEAGFTPAPRTNPPASDGNTLALWYFDEGTGTALDNEEGTAARDGTISNGSWATSNLLSSISPGERVYNWGYEIGSDAANEGYYIDETVSAGDDWVIRAVAHSDGTSIPKAILYDQDNGAEIGSLTGSTGSTRAAPDVFIFTGEAPAGNTTLRVKLINTQASGVTYWHQVELLANLITNPSLQGGAGDPYIPTGWTNLNLDAGDSAQETTIVHSGSDSLQYNTGASSEGVWTSIGTGVIGNFYSLGAWIYGDGAITLSIRDQLARMKYQASDANIDEPGGVAAAWSLANLVGRQSAALNRIYINALAGASGERFLDDVYAFKLDAVSITATPASEANSAESSGIRVDGLDTLTQPIVAGSIATTSGKIRMNYIPRHDAADVAKFGETTPYILDAYGDADDYIRLYWSAANTITLLYQSDGGGEQSDTWDATGAIAADTTYLIEIEYSSTQMTLSVDGAVKITIAAAVSFGTVPATFYAMTKQDGLNIGDAVALNP